MRNPNGFTLVELLVVVAIISLLISILLPALSKARKASEAAVCGGNLHTLAIATVAYTSENNGEMMDHLIQPSDQLYSPWQTRSVNWIGNKDEWGGLAKLWINHIVDSPKFLYCPGQKTPYFTFEYYLNDQNQWGIPKGSSDPRLQVDDMVRVAYMFNPHQDKSKNNGVKYRRINEMNATDVLAVDTMEYYDWAPHPELQAVSAMYPDASVQLHVSERGHDVWKLRHSVGKNFSLFHMVFNLMRGSETESTGAGGR